MSQAWRRNDDREENPTHLLHVSIGLQVGGLGLNDEVGVVSYSGVAVLICARDVQLLLFQLPFYSGVHLCLGSPQNRPQSDGNRKRPNQKDESLSAAQS